MVRHVSGWLSSEGLFFEDEETAIKHERRQDLFDIIGPIYDLQLPFYQFLDRLLDDPRLYIEVLKSPSVGK